MARILVKEITEVPLHILPAIIARQIRAVGNRIYRISVKRTHWHHYNISTRTKLIRKEIKPTEIAPGSPAIHIVTDKRSRKSSKGCAA